MNESSTYDVLSLASWLKDPSEKLKVPYAPLPWKRLILVCTHAARDKRCGKIGPQVIEALEADVLSRGLTQFDVYLRGSSHIGGHEYAGLAIVYPECDWYGYLSKRNMKEFLDSLLASKRLEKCFRGRGSKYEW